MHTDFHSRGEEFDGSGRREGPEILTATRERGGLARQERGEGVKGAEMGVVAGTGRGGKDWNHAGLEGGSGERWRGAQQTC